MAAINSAVALNLDRPRNLLVFVNPVSGSWKSRQVWGGGLEDRHKERLGLGALGARKS